MAPKPFTIDVPQQTLDDLQERLARTRWSDSVFRYSKVVPMLTDSFDIVVPSLPGVGLSDKPATRGGAPDKAGTRPPARGKPAGRSTAL